ncbi:AI-2E family transporter [Collinsella sp. AGMB00827]|uniref:AI-2E family transporter n=1 Tax=Collinsella ureilytica TaxID=2869515 RepID=A0ABS7MM16_9ACTN|nr:AI-2E family transporter [Collinsella urealyticum]MBY4798098.1 AI-2E family transporter [Collinsella urealyticum]
MDSEPQQTSQSHSGRWASIGLKLWTVIGCGIIVLAATKLLAALSAAVMFLAVGCIIAFIATPMTDWLCARNIVRPLAVILAVAAVVIVIILAIALMAPVLTAQIIQMLSETPRRIAEISSWFSQLEADHRFIRELSSRIDTDAALSSVQSMANQFASGLLFAVRDGIVPMVNNVASALFIVFLGMVLAYWLTLDFPRIHEEICCILGERRAGDYRLMMAVVGQSVGGYLRSMVIGALVRGVLAFLGFILVSHPYAGTMATLTALLSFIPVIGPILAVFISALTGLFAGPSVGFWTLIAALVAQSITDNVIAPKINESTMSVHPVLSLVALMIGSALGSAMGMVIAIPLAAVAKSLFIFYFEEQTGRQIVSYGGAIFKGTPYCSDSGSPAPVYDALGGDVSSLGVIAERIEHAGSVSPAKKPEQSRGGPSGVKRLLAKIQSRFASEHTDG